MKTAPRKFELTSDILLRAYSIGVFPMAESRDAKDLFWVEPQERGIFPLDGLIVSRSLAKTVRSDRFRVVADRAFETVMRACAEREKTWINDEIVRLYGELFAAGHAHSLEAYEGDALVGGLYGVSLRGAFFGESMFHRARDASKVALVHLFARLRPGGFRLLDAQFSTEHLASLGAVEISRDTFRLRLAEALDIRGEFRRLARRNAMSGAEALQRARGDGTEVATGEFTETERRSSRTAPGDKVWAGGMAAFDEMGIASGETRPLYRQVARWLEDTPPELLAARRAQAEYMFRRIGITFGVYGDKDAAERLIPFDIVPRLISRAEWRRLEAGLTQRARALNLFLKDVYGPRAILKETIIPPELILRNPFYRPEMIGRRAPHDIWVHIAGIDIVRVDDEEFYVLEDNARTPSGVSYMLENREVTMRLLPDLFARHSVAPVDDYPDQLLACLRSVAPRLNGGEATIVILTPGAFNSAYYEHSFLADKLGVELVEGRDLFVEDDQVFMRTTLGPRRVDVIYRRVDDDFLDPLVFNPASVLGVPGLVGAYLAGNVTIANAIGTGIADDKAIYCYIPELIRFYLSEEPLLKNVPTYRCREPSSLKYVMERLDQLVVKEVNGSGGYGMLVGPHASAAQREQFGAKIMADPNNYIAQPTLALSTCPASFESGVSPRHVDLRPFVLSGADGVRIVPGGLTRVALKEGSLVVNSSQGGGTKDTWIVDDAEGAA